MLKGSCSVSRDNLENRQVRMTFKLVNPKYKDPVSVPNNSLSLNLLVAGLKCVNSEPIFNSRIF